MNQCNTSMTMIDAGPYDTALAITLARNDHEVALWDHDLEHIVTLGRGRCGAVFPPDVFFPDTLHPESDPATALAANRSILVVVPSHVLGEVLRQIKPLMRPDACLVRAIKGLGVETGRSLQDVAHEALDDQIPLAVIPGPMFAKEPVIGSSTATSLASIDQTFADDPQQLLHCGKSFRVYSNLGSIGMQLGDAMKNVIAIDAGMSDGIGFGINTRTAPITRGLAKISRFGAALGADPVIFTGVAGFSDLVLTCTDNQSRNRRLGMMLGQSMDMQSTQEKVGQVVEGYCNMRGVRELACRFGVEVPIVEEIYQVSYCGENVCEAASTLLGRARKDERSSY